MTTAQEINLDPEQQRAEIQRALAAQQSKIAVRNHNAPAVPTASGERYVYAPHDLLKAQLNEALGKWTHVKQTSQAGQLADQYAKPRALAAIYFLDSALAKLGTRTGPREDAARQALFAQRDRIAGALAHFESLGASLDGPRAREICDRITATRAALEAAYSAETHATRDTVEDAMLEVRKWEAESRSIDRDLEAARAALVVPEFPNVEDFGTARVATESLERMPGKNPSARAMHQVLHDAFTATKPAVARLFVVYETAHDHALVKLRAKAIAEAGQ